MPQREKFGRTERGTVLALAAVNLVGLGSLTAPVVAGLPLKINAIFPEDERAAALATALALGGLAALIGSPLFGVLSDRTQSRFGRRRPWMLGGVLVGFVCIAAFAVADSFPMIVITWVAAQLAFNSTLSASTALLSDTVSDGKRASASGIFTAAAFVGALPPIVLVALMPQQVSFIILVMPALAIVVVGFAMRIPERDSNERIDEPRAPKGDRRFSLSFAFSAVWMQRFAMQSAFSMATAFSVYFVLDRFASTIGDATTTSMVAMLLGGAGIVAGAVVGGAWASRSQRYLLFLGCSALGLGAAATMRAAADRPVLFWLAACLGGIAVGVYLAVNLALAMRVVPADRAGTYLGILNVAETIPQVLVPIGAAALLRMGGADPVSGASDNYVMLYGAAAVLALLSLATLPTLRDAARKSDRVASFVR